MQTIRFSSIILNLANNSVRFGSVFISNQTMPNLSYVLRSIKVSLAAIKTKHFVQNKELKMTSNTLFQIK